MPVFNELVDAENRKPAGFDPVAAFRVSGYRARVSAERPAVTGAGGGIAQEPDQSDL